MRYASRCIANDNDTLKIHMKQLAMRFTPFYDAVRFDFDSTQCKNMIAFISLVQTDSNYKLTRGLFHKTRLPNRPGLFQLV